MIALNLGASIDEKIRRCASQCPQIPSTQKRPFQYRIYALQSPQTYLHGAKFVIRMDHKPLRCLLGRHIQNTIVAR